ncbi:MAG: FAD-binding protein [Acetivibrionales bacterium]|jgi:succinate dehydrogenase/fumarate reductase flavoprotein subunit
MRKIDRFVETEVLAVGGSGAGVTAAIFASRNGVKVTLVSKGKVGYSGNAIMAGGGFGIDGESGKNFLGYEGACPDFTKAKLFDCIIKEGFYLSDQNMAAQYVEEGPVIVKEYLVWAEHAKQDFLFYPPCNWISSGISFSRAVLHGLKETNGVQIMEDVIIVEILTVDNAVTGAIGIDIYTGETILFSAKAVVIGTGGYQPFSMKNTVTDMTGDGPGMAYRAGAKLTDMEFMLAFPTAVVPHEMRGSIYPFVFEYNMPDLKYTVRDKNMEALPIPDKIISMSRGNKLSKLVSSYYFGHALDKGLGGPNGGLFYDYSENSLEVKKQQLARFYGLFDRWHKHGYYKGESLAEVEEMIYKDIPLEVGLGFEYCMGGIEVNENMETSINGLYAAGEASSGVFGACRVRDGLVEMLCQGMRAGISASAYCHANELQKHDKDLIDFYLDKIFGYYDHKEGISPVILYNEIERACDEGFGVIRCEEKLQNALKRIIALKQELTNATLKNQCRCYNNEWLMAIQAENLLICCEAGIRAAILRKESRGCHIRKDHPMVDHDNYMIKYILSKDGDSMKIEKRRPVVTAIPLPSGQKTDIIDYFLDPELNYNC